MNVYRIWVKPSLTKKAWLRWTCLYVTPTAFSSTIVKVDSKKWSMHRANKDSNTWIINVLRPPVHLQSAKRTRWFVISQRTSKWALRFHCWEPSSLLSHVHYHSDLCNTAYLLLSKLCSREEMSMYEAMPDWSALQKISLLFTTSWLLYSNLFPIKHIILLLHSFLLQRVNLKLL